MNDHPISETGKGMAACLWSLLWRMCVLFPLAGMDLVKIATESTEQLPH